MADIPPAGPGNELFPSSAWRLLLPDPAPRTVAEIGARAVSAGAQTIGARVVAAGAQPELAVAGDLRTETLDRLGQVVPPGGAAYAEGRWPRGRGTAAVARHLAAAGFVSSRLYSLCPSRHRWRTSWWVPVGCPAVVQYLIDRQREDVGASTGLRSTADRLRLDALARIEPMVSRQPWLLHPARHQYLCVVATKPLAGATTSAAPGLVLERGADSSAGENRAVAMRVGGTSTDQPMLLVFEADRSEPSIVVKAPERAEERAGSRYEQGVLHELTIGRSPMPGVPRPIELAIGPRIGAQAQTALPGRAATAMASPATFDSLARAVTEWLIDLGAATIRPAAPSWYRHLVDTTFELLDEAMAGREPRRQGVHRLRPLLADFDPGVVVRRHGDLGPWNILVDRAGRIGVVDWAESIGAGPPGCDLIHFLTHLALRANDAYDSGHRDAVAMTLSDPTTPMGAVADRCVERYFDGLELARPALPQLRALTWALDIRRQEPDERPHSLYAALLAAELDRLPADSLHRSAPTPDNRWP